MEEEEEEEEGRRRGWNGSEILSTTLSEDRDVQIPDLQWFQHVTTITNDQGLDHGSKRLISFRGFCLNVGVRYKKLPSLITCIGGLGDSED